MRLITLAARRLFPGAFYEFIIGRAIKAVLRRHSSGSIRIVRHLYYGATYINPRHLVIWYIVDSNDELNAAKTSTASQTIFDDTRAELLRRGYPAAAVDVIHVGLESQENIDK